MWRKPLAVACNRSSSSKWHSRLRITDGIYNWLASFIFQHPMVHFMVSPFPLLSWLMRRAARVSQEALCRPGGATFCFWSINNANEAMVPSLCLDDRSRHLPFIGCTLLDLWRLPPWLAAERQTSAHLAISLIFMSAPWGVNKRRSKKWSPIVQWPQLGPGVGIKGSEKQASYGKEEDQRRPVGRQPAADTSHLLREFSPKPRGLQRWFLPMDQNPYRVDLAKYIIHRATAFDLLTSRASCFTFWVIRQFASSAHFF